MTESKKREKRTSQTGVIRAVSEDFLMNIAATVISTGTMQLLLYPRLAASLGEISYGNMLTIMGVINVATLAFGNNLAQVRLISEQKYIEREEKGDFQIFLFMSCFLSLLCMIVVCFCMSVSIWEMIPIIILTLTTILKSYYLVTFRLSIDYKKNLIANVIMCLGYVIGSLVLLNFLHWSWAFILANVFCIVYICRVSKIALEPFKITCLFKASAKTYVMLITGGLLSNITTYLDRFVVYPILGAASVSCFFVATYFSKALSLICAPMTNVFLSYFSQGRIRLTRSLFILINFAIIVLSILLVLICVTFGAWITEILFPGLYLDAAQYILLAAIGTVINTVSSFNGTVVLVVASSVWQTIIPGVCMTIYLILAVLLSLTYGLIGMCFALILSGLLRFVLNFVVGLRAIKEAV